MLICFLLHSFKDVKLRPKASRKIAITTYTYKEIAKTLDPMSKKFSASITK